MIDGTLIKLGIVLGAWLGLVFLALVLFYSTGYRLTPTHLVITVLRIPVRRIRIRDIRHMGTETRGWAERYYNTLSPVGRRLVIRRKHGLLSRTLIITPVNPFGLMHDIQAAKDKLKASEKHTVEV